ncbi:MAG: tetratricopeptide repeat protein, partial [Candidatus Omnitrophota bacterium]|nr:tetratricopeptide repeat protein [Candidatus Omnitrophota bacterium]
MKAKIFLSALFFNLICYCFAINNLAYAGSMAADYLCDMGTAYYKLGKYEDALRELRSALLVDSDNQIAKKYINLIILEELDVPVRSSISKKDKLVGEVSQKKIPSKSKDEAMGEALHSFAGRETKVKLEEKPEEKKQKANESGVLSGEYRLGLGISSDGVIWKDANADKVGVPREKNWQYLWGEQRHNTYDPKIYDRLRLNMQTQFDSPLNAFMEVTIDPWTFVGKNHVTINAVSGGDVVDMDLKYWSADRRTINETYRSKKGNIINLKQIKVVDNKTTVATPTGISDWATSYAPIQPTEINRDYQPIRKFWFDYIQDDYALKVFLISDEGEALTTDDPLRISNNHVYWEESPWLDEYEPSRIFKPDSGLNPLKKGRWIRRLSFFAKDSSDDCPHRLTFLRGASFNLNREDYSLNTTVATPKSLWDDYENSNSIDAAIRLKVPLQDNLQLGFTTTSKMGLSGGSAEALNQVQAVDLSYRPAESHHIYAEIGESHTDIQETKGFDTEYDGVAAKLGYD